MSRQRLIMAVLLVILAVLLFLAARANGLAAPATITTDLCGVPVALPEWMHLTCTPATDTGAGYWQLTHFEALDPDQGGGNHHYYVKLYDDGVQLSGLPFSVAWDDGSDTALTKPAPDYGDIPLWDCYPLGEPGPYRGFAGLAHEEAKSDTVWGMGLPVCQHWSFVAEFEWQAAPICQKCTPRAFLPMVRK